jgi:hypothetical protein
VVERQLDLFGREHADLLSECEDALVAFRAADRAEAEERYGDYADLVDSACEELASLRDSYAGTLGEGVADAYCTVFNRRARKRYPDLTAELR